MILLRLAPLALLLACGGKDPDLVTGAVTGTATGNGAVESECADGIDNDGDGLLDCEDGDCAGAAACAEQNCDNEADDDGDGFIDCADADCWGNGNGCFATMARVTSSGPARWVGTDAALSGGGKCPNTPLIEGTISLQSPVGKIRIMSADATTWTSCDWSADSSFVQGGPAADPWAIPHVGQRTNFVIDPACPMQVPVALPVLLTIASEGGDWGLRTGVDGTGVPWFGFSTTPDNQVVNTFNVPHPQFPACVFSGDQFTSTWNTPDVGFDVIRTGPVGQTSSGTTTGSTTGTATGMP